MKYPNRIFIYVEGDGNLSSWKSLSAAKKAIREFGDIEKIAVFDRRVTVASKIITDMSAAQLERALDGAKAPRKSKRSTGSPRK